MKSTEYITGKPKSYFEPETTALATKRIKACRELMSELANKRKLGILDPEDITRYMTAEESVKWWTKILEEE